MNLLMIGIVGVACAFVPSLIKWLGGFCNSAFDRYFELHPPQPED